MALSSFVWTDKESELLLSIVLEYKVEKTEERTDWESCRTKYVDILDRFLELYPAETSEDFPHAGGEGVTRSILTTKIKAIRCKYRQAMESGRRSGFGKVVRLYYELCEKIWGRSPIITTITSGFETPDLGDSLPLPSPPTSTSSTLEPPEAVSDTEQESSLVPKQRLRARLKGNRQERLKRRLSGDNLWLSVVEEDQRMKKRFVDFLETSERRAAESLEKITSTLHTLSTSITEGFALLRQAMTQPPPVPCAPHDPRGQIYLSTPSAAVHPTFHLFHTTCPNTHSSVNNNDASVALLYSQGAVLKEEEKEVLKVLKEEQEDVWEVVQVGGGASLF